MQYLRFFVFLFFTTLVCAQQEHYKKEIDSIEKIINRNVHDTIRIYSLLELANIYQDIDLDVSIKKANRAYDLIKKTNYQRGLNYFYIVKCRENIYLNNNDIGLEYAKKAQLNSFKSNDYEKYVYGFYYEAIIYSIKNEHNNCIKTLNKILKYIKGKREIAIIGDLYMTLGSAYSRNLNNDKAIQAFNKAIPFYRKRNDVNGIHNCYYESAQIYTITKNFKKALEYCNKAIDVNYKGGKFNERDNCTDLIMLGLIYVNLKDTQKALYYINKAKISYQKAGGVYEKWFLFHSLINVYQMANEQETIIKLCNNELRQNKTIDENLLLLYNYKALASFEKNNIKEAVKNIETVFSIINVNPSLYITNDNLALFNDNASRIYSKDKQYNKAFEHLSNYRKITEKINDDLNQQKILKLQEEFNAKENEALINQLKLKEQKKDIEAEKQKNKYYIVSLVLLIVSSILFFIGYTSSTIKKKNFILNRHNIIVEAKNHQLSNSKSKLEKLVSEKDVLIKEIHHRVKNNLQLVMSLLNIQSRINNHPDVEEFLSKGQNRIKTMALVHQNLYQTENLSNVDFEQYLLELIDSIKSTYGDSVDNVKFNIKSEKLFFDIRSAIPLGLIINELLCNSLKYAFPNKRQGEINITSKQLDKETIEIVFFDNGVGYSDKQVAKEAMGLKLVRLLAQQLKGNLLVENTNEGLKYNLSFSII